MPDNVTATAQDIRNVCDGLRDMLLSKNARYGDSALTPVRIFSRADPVEQLLVRIDDKLSRLSRGALSQGGDDEDVVSDLAGYLVLLMVARRRRAEPTAPATPPEPPPAPPPAAATPAESVKAKPAPKPSEPLAPEAPAHLCEGPNCSNPTRPGKRYCSAACAGRGCAAERRARNNPPAKAPKVPKASRSRAAVKNVEAPRQAAPEPEATPARPAGDPASVASPVAGDRDLPDGPSMTVDEILALGFSDPFVTRAIRDERLVLDFGCPDCGDQTDTCRCNSRKESAVARFTRESVRALMRYRPDAIRTRGAHGQGA